MSLKKLYFSYAISIFTLGLLGFFITHAKSALISALVGGFLFWLFGFILSTDKFLIIFARFCNLVLLAAFSWRFVKAWIIFNSVSDSNFIPMVLLGLLALISAAVFLKSFSVKRLL